MTNLATVGINTTGAVGFAIVGGAVDMAIVRPAGLAAGNKTSYLGLQISLVGASLIGIDGLKFNASGKVLLNKATAADGSVAAQKINWGAATGSLLPVFSASLTSGLDLSISGQASVDIFGFVVGTAGFSMALGRANVTNTGFGSGTLANAAVTSVTLSNLNLFAGVGAALNDSGTLTPDDDVIDKNNAVGFSIAGGSVSMAMVRPATNVAGDRSGYLGLAISLANASLVGIDGLTLSASGTVLVNKATTSAGLASIQRINWVAATDSAGLLPNLAAASNSRLTASVELAIEGNAAINLFGFIVGSASMQFTSSTVNVDQNGNGVFSLPKKT